MRVESLRVRGIGRFEDEVDLPVSRLSDNDRLIAVVGKNGEGKSTMLGCVPGALYHHVPGYGAPSQLALGRDSLIELGLSVGQRQLVVRLMINADANPIKQQAYLSVDGEHVVSTGKVTEYRRAIVDILPPLETYLASAFASQDGQGRFLDLPRAQRRSLFARMLGHDHLQMLAKRAKGKSDEIYQKTNAKIVTMEMLEERMIDRSEAAEELAQAEKDYQLAADNLKHFEAKQSACKIDHDKWEIEKQKLSDKLSSTNGTIERAKHKLLAAKNDLSKAKEALKYAQNIQAAIDAATKQLQGEPNWFAVYNKAVERVERLKVEIAAAKCITQKQQDAWSTWVTRRNALDVELVNLRNNQRGKYVDSTHKLQVAEKSLKDAKRKVDIVKSLPCSGNQQSVCRFAKDAYEAMLLVEDLQKNHDDAFVAQQRYKRASPEELDKIKEIDELNQVQKPDQTEVDRLEAQLFQIENNRQEALTSRQRMAVIEERKAVLTEQLDEWKRTHASVAETKQKIATLMDKVTVLANIVDRGERDTGIISTKLEEHETMEPEFVCDTLIRKHMTYANNAAMIVGERKTELARANTDFDTVQKIKSEISSLSTELNDWHQLHDVLGPEGAQALLIDAAGPEVSSIANDLLSECYGDRFVLQLVTTAPRADGKGVKEVFDLTVIDTERAREARAESFSGGEKVIINEALSLAIAIYNTRRSGQEIGDLFRDECSGALHETQAPLYVSMLRKAINMGGFSRCYFITHQSELADLADAVITFANGKCR
jgi:exonuclease SbcC